MLEEWEEIMEHKTKDAGDETLAITIMNLYAGAKQQLQDNIINQQRTEWVR
jgi:hypothetical protein